ncbi:MAG: hypothetical protein ACLFPL_01860 [Candidatus Nanoarchaeia archaeon]
MKKKSLTFKLLFLSLFLIFLFISISFPLLEQNNQDRLNIYTYEEFITSYSNSTYDDEENILSIIEKNFEKSTKKSNSVIEIYENKDCLNNCEIRKIIVNKNKQHIIVKERNKKNEKPN